MDKTIHERLFKKLERFSREAVFTYLDAELIIVELGKDDEVNVVQAMHAIEFRGRHAMAIETVGDRYYAISLRGDIGVITSTIALHSLKRGARPTLLYLCRHKQNEEIVDITAEWFREDFKQERIKYLDKHGYTHRTIDFDEVLSEAEKFLEEAEREE